MTERLNEAKADVPGQLAPTIDALTNTLEAAEAPQTSPQDRQGVIESARRLTTALTTIADDSTPGKLRQQLITLVKQTSSTLQMGRDQQMPPQQRSLVVLAVKRATFAVKVICDPETPQKQRDRLIATLGNGFSALRQGHGDQRIDENFRDEGTGLATAAGLPAERRGQLTETAYRHSQALRRFSDPRTSAEDRVKAAEDLEGQGARMGEEQEGAAPVAGGQDTSIAQEATACTNAVFESVAEHRLAESLRRLVPDAWDSEGVKDFWKAEEVRTEKDKFLDVLAQLRNSQRVHAPVEIASLITEFTEIVPRVKLYRTLGGPAASYCEQTASDLDQEYDVDVGNWLADSGQE
ncbi:hypothetical protein [Streptomyces canus]|uniref:hypothetical protein n=1 Tax=Streptomyces canus TaxID=58343 RepID=UPI002E30A875|nr:hypothetical protein [Streptomyces canus]